MISMTGFGYREYQDETIHITTEMKSYNNRYLDLTVSLPPPLNPLEKRIRNFLQEQFSRGRIEFYLRMRELEENVSIHLDSGTAEKYANKLRQLIGKLSIDEDLRLGHILHMEGVLKTDKSRDLEKLWTIIEPLLVDASQQLLDDRKREGSATKKDILTQIDLLEESVNKIDSLKETIKTKVHQTLKERFSEVLGDEVEQRLVLEETALILSRFDINEELQRLNTHLKSFRETSELDEPVGKKLDFICQELNRETNTIGSKSGGVEISQTVIEMKNAIEKIREQVRNVE